MAHLDGVLPAMGQPVPLPPETYLERAAKYVPAEVLAFSLFVNCILDQAIATGGKSASMANISVTGIATLALVVGFMATPLFVWYVRTEGDAWVTNAIVSTALFPFWAYAMGQAAFSEMHDGNLAAIMLASVTVGSGLISPPLERRNRRDRQKNPNERPQLVEVSGSQFSA
jgi:hypothetical protein